MGDIYMQLFRSRTGAVVAGAAVLVLAGGGTAAFADREDPPGHDKSPALNDTSGALTGYEVTNSEERWDDDTTETVTMCADGKVALGGGYEIDGTANGSAAGTEIVDDAPVYADGAAVGWRTAGVPEGDVNVKTWVICADAE